VKQFHFYFQNFYFRKFEMESIDTKRRNGGKSLSDDADVVVGEDDRVGLVVAGLVGAAHRPEAGERIALGLDHDLHGLHLTPDDVQVVLGVLAVVEIRSCE
jgi:hypothetical protein